MSEVTVNGLGAMTGFLLLIPFDPLSAGPSERGQGYP